MTMPRRGQEPSEPRGTEPGGPPPPGSTPPGGRTPTPPAAPPASSTPAPPPQPPARRPGQPFWFLFEIHEDPIFDHPLWLEHANTVPCVRVDVRTEYTVDGAFTWRPAAGPETTASALIKLLYRLESGFGPHMGPRARAFNWYFQLAGLGAVYDAEHHRGYPNVHPLLGHPEDHLRSGRRGPFAKRGIEVNRAWTAEFAEIVAKTLKQRGLPDPVASVLASENGVKDDFGGHLGNPDTGWVPEALRDPRADDRAHTIDGVNTFRAYFDAARCIDGSPVPAYKHDAQPGMPPGRHPVNAESSERYQGALRRLWEWARWKGFAEPLRDAFASEGRTPPPVGEYQAGSDSKANPVMSRPGHLLHQMDGFFQCQLQCPDWYGDLPWGLLEDTYFSSNHAGWNTESNWYRALNVDTRAERSSPTRRRQVAALELAKRTLRAHALSAPQSLLAPYCESLRGMTLDDMLDYLRTCRDLGGFGVNVFMPKSTRAAHDEWYRIVRAMAQ